MLALAFTSYAGLAFALENYPPFPGLPLITNSSGLPEVIQYFFGIGIYFSGALALISLAIAGVQIIIGQANPEGVSNAKDRIRGSLFGLTLTMVCYIMIQYINPAISSPNITAIANNPGVFYINSSENKQYATPSSESDTTTIPTGFTVIKYNCAQNASGASVGPKLLVWTYPEKNFGNPTEAATHELECGNTLPVNSGLSFKTAYKDPGVYFYSGPDCSVDGYRSNIILTSGELPEEFKNGGSGAGQSVEFVNDPANDIYYGVIFHDNLDENRGGNCQAPLISSTQARDCKPINIKASSATIFTWNNTPVNSGNGVNFYSAPYGWDAKGAKAGIYSVDKTLIKATPLTYIDPGLMYFVFTGSGVDQEEQNADKTFKDSPGSIQIKGNYLVALYSGTGDGYCQVFNKDVVDMKGTEYVSAGSNNDLSLIYVIPLK